MSDLRDEFIDKLISISNKFMVGIALAAFCLKYIPNLKNYTYYYHYIYFLYDLLCGDSNISNLKKVVDRIEKPYSFSNDVWSVSASEPFLDSFTNQIYSINEWLNFNLEKLWSIDRGACAQVFLA